MTAMAAAPALETIGTTEATEEPLHRRTRRERHVVIEALVVRSLLRNLDANRNHRRFHALDNVGKAHRLLNLADVLVDLRVRRRGQEVAAIERGHEAIAGGAEAGDDG